MKKQAIIIISLSILINMIGNIGDIRCQETNNTIDAQYQAKYMEIINKGADEDNLKGDKNAGVKILELMIKYKLFYEYQTVDSKELEERLERSR